MKTINVVFFLVLLFAIALIIFGFSKDKKPIVIKITQHYDGTLDFESKRILEIINVR